MEKTIVVTGGSGFIGSNFILQWMEQEDTSVVNLDRLTYAGNPRNLLSVSSDPRYSFVKGDVCDRELLRGLLQVHKPRAIVHFAAESHVDRSIEGPGDFIQTNIVGTFNLLEACREAWLDSDAGPGGGFRFHHVSTDEVYGSLGATGYFTETTPYAPNSPYSASKAAVAMLTKSLAIEWASRGVNVNAIAPGVFRTALNQELLDDTERGREFLLRTPMKRFGKIEELAGAAVFLASDAASFITGEVLVVDGGFLASGVNQ